MSMAPELDEEIAALTECLRERTEDRDRLRKVLLMVASGHQGGHSASGGAIADLFGIPFPLTMPNLEIAAKKHGFDPNELWPWLAPMRAGKTS